MQFRRNWEVHVPLRIIELQCWTLVWVYQWDRWEVPELDILVKYKEGTKRLRTPKHIHWVIDILIKKEHNRELTLNFLNYLYSHYENIDRFGDKNEQENCSIEFFTNEALSDFKDLDNYWEYSIEFIGCFLELFIRMEKNHPNPFVFKDLMETLIQEDDIFRIVSKATQNGR